MTTNVDAFLEYKLVTVEWSVNEITIQDKYELVLNATYETNVPAPVVVIEPMSINLPDMKAGEVFNTELTITNYGLVRADGVNFKLPSGDSNFKYETSAVIPDSITSKQRIKIPVKVTCLKPFKKELVSGGGCYNYRTCGGVYYQYLCANGYGSWGDIGYCFTATTGANCSGGASGSTTSNIYHHVQAGSGSYTPQPTTVKGGPTFTPPVGQKENATCDVNYPTGSSVNATTGNYSRSDSDLSVKMQGGSISVSRTYDENGWRFSPGDMLISSDKMNADGTIGSDSDQNPSKMSFSIWYDNYYDKYKVPSAITRNGKYVYRKPTDSYYVKNVGAPNESIVDTGAPFTHGDGYVIYRPGRRFHLGKARRLKNHILC